MRVHHLINTKYGLDNLKNQRIKISRFSELNDPFELLAIDIRNRDLRAGIRARKNLVNNKEGLISFSKEWRNPVLWSHYGDKHKGLCLSFEIPDDKLTEVEYSSGMKKLNIHAKETTQDVINKTLNELRYTKFKDWEYEKEYRLFVNLRKTLKTKEHHFHPFSESVLLKEVILGPSCTISVEEIEKITSQYPHKVWITKSRIAFSKFGVTRDTTLKQP